MRGPWKPPSEKLPNSLDMPTEELADKVRRQRGASSYQPVLLKQDIGRDALAAIEVRRFDIPGVNLDVRPVRHYIDRNSASHLIGYLGGNRHPRNSTAMDTPAAASETTWGKFGVEKTYERYLRGSRGGQQVEVDATGQVIRVLKTVEARPGGNVYLSILRDLQAEGGKFAGRKGRCGGGRRTRHRPCAGHGQQSGFRSKPLRQRDFPAKTGRSWWKIPCAPWKTKPFRPSTHRAPLTRSFTAIAGLEEGGGGRKLHIFLSRPLSLRGSGVPLLAPTGARYHEHCYGPGAIL